MSALSAVLDKHIRKALAYRVGSMGQEGKVQYQQAKPFAGPFPDHTLFNSICPALTHLPTIAYTNPTPSRQLNSHTRRGTLCSGKGNAF